MANLVRHRVGFETILETQAFAGVQKFLNSELGKASRGFLNDFRNPGVVGTKWPHIFGCFDSCHSISALARRGVLVVQFKN